MQDNRTLGDLDLPAVRFNPIKILVRRSDVAHDGECLWGSSMTLAESLYGWHDLLSHVKTREIHTSSRGVHGIIGVLTVVITIALFNSTAVFVMMAG